MLKISLPPHHPILSDLPPSAKILKETLEGIDKTDNYYVGTYA